MMTVYHKSPINLISVHLRDSSSPTQFFSESDGVNLRLTYYDPVKAMAIPFISAP